MRRIRNFGEICGTVGALAIFASWHSAQSAPILVTQALDFSTTGQSLWAPGTSPPASGSFVIPNAIDAVVTPTTKGQIVTSSVPNPAYAAFQVLVNGCNALPTGVQACLNALPDAPPQNLSVKNGATLSYSGSLNIGLSGSVSVTPGMVDAGYSGQASISVDKSNAAPGEKITISTSATGGVTSLSSAFSGLQAIINATVAGSVHANLTAYVADVGGTVPIQNLDFPATNVPLVDATAFGTPSGTEVTVSIPAVPTTQTGTGVVTIHQNIPVANGAGIKISVPFVSETVQLPALDVSKTANGDSVGTDVQPISRLCLTLGDCASNPTDFARLTTNIAAATYLAAQVPIGIKVGIEHALNVELDAFAGNESIIGELSQQLSFDPNLKVRLEFNKPVMVETSPGHYELLDSYTVPVGASVSLLQPDGDLTIKPVYTLVDNILTNATKVLTQLVYDVQLLHFGVSGPAQSFSGLPDDFTALSYGIPLSPISVLGNLTFDDGLSPTPPSFALQGFTDVDGTPFTLTALPSDETVARAPEPSPFAILCLSLAGLGYMRRRVTA
jgi:hypothetical protein